VTINPVRCTSSLRIALMSELLDVVNQAVQLPLSVDLDAAPKREPIKPLVVPDIGEHRFHYCKAPAVEGPALRRVDALLHPVGV